MAGASPKRAYDNSLREQQAQATRERILDAMAHELAEDGVTEFSVGRVAKRAGVSEPTIYRHFGGREGLFEAFSTWFEQRGGHPGYPTDLESFVDTGVDAVFAYFDEHEAYIRAAQTSQAAEVFKAGRRKRRKVMGRALGAATDHLDAKRARQVKAMFGYLLGSRAYLALKDEFGLSTEDAAAAVNWAARTLIEDLQADQPRRRRGSKKR